MSSRKTFFATVTCMVLATAAQQGFAQSEAPQPQYPQGQGQNPQYRQGQGPGAPPPEEQKKEVPRKLVRDHFFQGVVNVTFGTGWYMVAPYDKNDQEKACGYDQYGEGEPVCTGRSGLHLDFLGGFGVKKGLEVVFMYRQGVESAAIGMPQPRYIGAGLKVYKPHDGLFKIGFGFIPLFDFSKRRNAHGNDFVIHFPILAHFDIVRWFGTYLQIAPNLSFATEFRFDINFGIGVQGRFP